MTTRLCVLGAGRMGAALVGGLVQAGAYRAEEIVVVDPVETSRERLLASLPGLVVADVPASSEAVILATKPIDAEAACRSLTHTDHERLLSIAAGVRLESLEGWLWDDAHVVRAMPNTPALVGAAASAISGGRHADEEDLAWAESVLGAVGIVVRLDESLLDAVTGISGSGPAYVFYLAEAMIAAGVDGGLSKEVASLLTNQTMLGAARLLVESGDSPAVLRAAVTSPNGTTAAAIAHLEQAGVQDRMRRAVQCAIERSKELGAPSS